MNRKMQKSAHKKKGKLLGKTWYLQRAETGHFGRPKKRSERKAKFARPYKGSLSKLDLCGKWYKTLHIKKSYPQISQSLKSGVRETAKRKSDISEVLKKRQNRQS